MIQNKIYRLFALIIMMVATWTGVSAAEAYKLTLAEGSEAHGTVSFKVGETALTGETLTAEEGQTVTITVACTGWTVSQITATASLDPTQMRSRNRSGEMPIFKEIPLTKGDGNVWTMTMPAADVEIGISYKEIPTVEASWITIADGSYIYNGQAIEPKVTVKDGETDVTTSFDISYSNNTDAGQATVTVTAKVGQTAYSGSASKSFTIAPQELTITTGSASKSYDGTPLTCEETTIQGLVEGETATVTATGSQTEIGSSKNGYTIEWGTAKSTNYLIVEALGTLEVTAGEITGITAKGWSGTYDGTAHSISFEGLTGNETVLYGESADNVTLTTAPAYTDAGTYTVYYKISKAGYDNLTGSATVTITQKALTITSESGTKEYDGKPLTASGYTAEGLVSGDRVASVKIEGSQTDVGSSKNTISDAKIVNAAGKDVTANYVITYVPGTLTVTEGVSPGGGGDDGGDYIRPDDKINYTDKITLIAQSASKQYDGKSLMRPGDVLVYGLPPVYTIQATATGSQTDVGKIDNVVSSYKIYNPLDEDVTTHFTNVECVNGVLEVTPATLTITTGSATKVWDGEPLTCDEVIVTCSNNHSFTVTATGSQTEVGSSENTYSIDWGSEKEGNYTITENLGTLTVTARAEKIVITITAASQSWTYDGDAHSNNTVTVTSGSLLAGDALVATATGSVKDVADTQTGNNPIAEGYKVMHGETDVTANYTITAEAGTLTITPRAAKITAQSHTFTYTGAAQSWNQYDVEGLVDKDAITAVITGSITYTNESPVDNVVSSYEFTSGKSDNYSVTTQNGQLMMTAATETTKNPDGSITERITNAIKDSDGTVTETITETTMNCDGSTSERIIVVKKDSDGIVTETITEKTNNNGIVTETVTETKMDSNGNTVSTSFSETVTKPNDDKTVTEIEKDADGKIVREYNYVKVTDVSEAVTETSTEKTNSNGTVTETFNETKKDANGNLMSSRKEITVTDPKGGKTYSSKVHNEKGETTYTAGKCDKESASSQTVKEDAHGNVATTTSMAMKKGKRAPSLTYNRAAPIFCEVDESQQAAISAVSNMPVYILEDSPSYEASTSIITEVRKGEIEGKTTNAITFGSIFQVTSESVFAVAAEQNARLVLDFESDNGGRLTCSAGSLKPVTGGGARTLRVAEGNDDDEIELISGQEYEVLNDDVVFINYFTYDRTPIHITRIYVSENSDDPAGIVSARQNAVDGTDTWYNLQGRKINQPTKKGLYIKDGRKVVIK